MKISIITPIYNRQHLVKRVIESVRGLNIPPKWTYEHIIVDDGSDDQTAAQIRANKYYKVKPIKLETNKGVNAARNKGIIKSTGDYILFLDSDDEITANALYTIKNALATTKQKYKIYKFQTKNIKTKKTMSHTSKPKLILNYKNKLKGNKVSGEFMTLTHHSIYKNNLFDEDKFAFEQVFWNRTLKKYNEEYYVPKTIRLYHSEEKDRLSNQLTLIKNAKRRVIDYNKYIQEFEKYYILFGLKKQIAAYYFRLGFFKMLNKEVNSKYWIKEAFKNNPCNSYLLCLIIPNPILYYTYKTMEKIKNVN